MEEYTVEIDGVKLYGETRQLEEGVMRIVCTTTGEYYSVIRRHSGDLPNYHSMANSISKHVKRTKEVHY